MDLFGQLPPVPSPAQTQDGAVHLTFSVREMVAWMGGIVSATLGVFALVVRWAISFVGSREEKYEKRLDEAISKFIASQEASENKWSESNAQSIEMVGRVVGVIEGVKVTVDQNTRVVDAVRQTVDAVNNRLQAVEMRVQSLPPQGRRSGNSGGA